MAFVISPTPQILLSLKQTLIILVTTQMSRGGVINQDQVTSITVVLAPCATNGQKTFFTIRWVIHGLPAIQGCVVYEKACFEHIRVFL